MCTYIAIINSIVVASSMLQVKFNYSEIDAGYYFTMPYIIAAVISPFLGFFVNIYGYHFQVTMLGSIIMIGAHVLSLLMPNCNQCWMSIVPSIMLGASYSTYAVVLWGVLTIHS